MIPSLSSPSYYIILLLPSSSTKNVPLGKKTTDLGKFSKPLVEPDVPNRSPAIVYPNSG